MCVKPGVLQEVTSSHFKHIDKPVNSHIPFYGAVCSTVEGDRRTCPSTDGKTYMCVKPEVLQEVTSSYFKHIDKPVHSHIPFYGAVCSTVEGDRGTSPSTDGKT